MNVPLTILGATLALAALAASPFSASAQSKLGLPLGGPLLVLDSFADDAPSSYGRWDFTTDRVMGGISDGGVTVEQVDDRRAMRMSGSVRLENNGGFIQSTLRLQRTMDASGFDGVAVDARALKPGSYYLFVRTSGNWLPWSYYSAPLEVTEDWSELQVPWTDFKGTSVLRKLDPSRLRSISVVAYGEAMAADIAVERIGLYAPPPQLDESAPSGTLASP